MNPLDISAMHGHFFCCCVYVWPDFGFAVRIITFELESLEGQSRGASLLLLVYGQGRGQ